MNDTFVIDGNNVCGWYENVHHEFSIAPLLSVMIALLENDDNFYCVFDASISHILKKHGKFDEAEFIEKLLSDYPENFFRVTGSSRADGTVLHYADHYKMRIITNDLFRDYIDKYSWLEEKYSPRLIQGNLQPSGLLTIDKLPYGHLELQDDLEKSSKRFIELLLLEKKPKKASYEFHSDRPGTKRDTSSRKHRSGSKDLFSETKVSRFNRKMRVHKVIWTVFLVIGIMASMYTTNWGLDYKINNTHQEIFNLGDQITHEESKIKNIKEKYSTIRFWQKKSQKDILEIEKAKTRIKILNAKRSEAKDERANLKKAIGRRPTFRPFWTSPLFVPWIIILVVYYFYVYVVTLAVLKKSLVNNDPLL